MTGHVRGVPGHAAPTFGPGTGRDLVRGALAEDDLGAAQRTLRVHRRQVAGASGALLEVQVATVRRGQLPGPGDDLPRTDPLPGPDEQPPGVADDVVEASRTDLQPVPAVRRA